MVFSLLSAEQEACCGKTGPCHCFHFSLITTGAKFNTNNKITGAQNTFFYSRRGFNLATCSYLYAAMLICLCLGWGLSLWRSRPQRKQPKPSNNKISKSRDSEGETWQWYQEFIQIYSRFIGTGQPFYLSVILLFGGYFTCVEYPVVTYVTVKIEYNCLIWLHLPLMTSHQRRRNYIFRCK